MLHWIFVALFASTLVAAFAYGMVFGTSAEIAKVVLLILFGFLALSITAYVAKRL